MAILCELTSQLPVGRRPEPIIEQASVIIVLEHAASVDQVALEDGDPVGSSSLPEI
jgi:hypothetical protein